MLFTLFIEFFKIGLFTFGGGYAMIPLIKEVVLKYEWLTEMEFFNFIGVCESTPGPIAINMATYIGSTQGGFLGGLIATIGVVLPSFIIILLIASLLKNFIENKYFKRILEGIKPVVVGLIFSTAILLIIKLVGYEEGNFEFDKVSVICFSIIVMLYYGVKFKFKKKINPIYLIILSAGLGILFSVLI